MDSLFDAMDVFIDTHPVATVIICIVIIVGAIIYIPVLYKRVELQQGRKQASELTPTQRFILAASSPTVGNNYKCVIDIWDTHLSSEKRDRVKTLFEWGFFCICDELHCQNGYHKYKKSPHKNKSLVVIEEV